MAREEKGNENEKKKKRKKHSRVGIIVKIAILLILITVMIVGIILYLRFGPTLAAWHDEAVAKVRQSTTETFRQSETSSVYDSKGNLITTLRGEKDLYYLTYDEIPVDAVKAMISIEDKKFRSHVGVDFKAILRAAKAYLENDGEVTQGGSTITQQLARNIFLTQEVSVERKVKEIFIAMELEKKYTKDQIMEFYLNNIYFGNGYYGLQAASKGYFSKDASELSVAQLTFLCAVPNNPTVYDPMDNSSNTVKRQGRILKQMNEDGVLSNTEYRKALEEPIKLDITKRKKKNYIETYVFYSAVRALMQKQGFVFRYTFDSEEERERYQERYDEVYTMCQQSMYSAGYNIYTSIDIKKQKKLQKSIDDELQNFEEKGDNGIYKLQGAATCIDNATGRVVAVVGGRTQKVDGYTLNRAYQSYRQPGSSIKPLIVYTPQLERGYKPTTIVNDVKTKDGPRNSNGSYAGKITLRSAVEQSKNTVAWALFEELTPRIGLSYLLQMGFARISDNDYYPAASLGGFTNGVTTVEMASGFSALENDGVFREPTCIIRITDSRENEIVSDKIDEKQVYDANAAHIMTDILEGVFTNGTGRGLGLENMSCAGKTGTTSDKKDGWFVGYTPYYTTSVWVGYDIPQTLSDLYGSTYPGRIWNRFMGEIHENLENIPFPEYKDEKTEKKEKPDIEQEDQEDGENEDDVEDVIEGGGALDDVQEGDETPDSDDKEPDIKNPDDEEDNNSDPDDSEHDSILPPQDDEGTIGEPESTPEPAPEPEPTPEPDTPQEPEPDVTVPEDGGQEGEGGME